MSLIEEGVISLTNSSNKPRKKSRPKGKFKSNNQNQSTSTTNTNKSSNDEEDEEIESSTDELCHICSSKIIIKTYYPCSHIVCHKCSMRRRALAKDFNCLFCRTQCPKVIMSSNLEYQPDKYDIQYEDTTYGIQFDNKSTRDRVLKLMEFNCPFKTCEQHGYDFKKWTNLKKHVKENHGRRYCDLCINHVQAFAYEQKTYTPKQLKMHEIHGDKEEGFSGHPLCKFCQIRFYTNDELMAHCVKDHEKCFVCQKLDPTAPPRFFKDYQQLENHFFDEHFACKIQSCIDKKFIVFKSQEELVHHMLEEHGDILGKSQISLNTDLPTRRYHSQLSTIPVSGSSSTSRASPGGFRNNESLFPELGSISASSRQRGSNNSTSNNSASNSSASDSPDQNPANISRRLEERAKILLQRKPDNLRKFHEINGLYSSRESNINEDELIENYKILFDDNDEEQIDILIHEFAQTLKVSNKKKCEKLESIYEKRTNDKQAKIRQSIMNQSTSKTVNSAPISGTWANRSLTSSKDRKDIKFPSLPTTSSSSSSKLTSLGRVGLAGRNGTANIRTRSTGPTTNTSTANIDTTDSQSTLNGSTSFNSSRLTSLGARTTIGAGSINTDIGSLSRSEISNSDKFPSLPKKAPPKRFPNNKPKPTISAWTNQAIDESNGINSQPNGTSSQPNGMSSSNGMNGTSTSNSTDSSNPTTMNGSKKKNKKKVLYVFNTFHAG